MQGPVTIPDRRRRRWPVVALLVVALAGAAGVLVASAGDADDALVVYNGRSHYGGEQAFADFEKETGIDVELFGGEAETLHQRLKSEGSDTPADVLVTVDGANLWRAEDEGLLQPLDSPAVDAAVPADLRDAQWTAVSTRVRTPVRSTERVDEGAVTSYADLGDARWRGRLCLRTSNNVYNQSFVADMIAKRGELETEALLESWMANDPTILGSDVEVLDAIASGQCDLGLTNHYYLARELAENPQYPVAPAWPEQDGAGAHANLSGAGIVAGSDRPEQARRLIEFLVQREAQIAIAEMGEFPANPDVEPEEQIAGWAGIKMDPMDVPGAGEHATDALDLMARVGWE